MSLALESGAAKLFAIKMPFVAPGRSFAFSYDFLYLHKFWGGIAPLIGEVVLRISGSRFMIWWSGCSTPSERFTT